MRTDSYPIIVIQPECVLDKEALGSKEKFWYRGTEDQVEWLFKYPQAGTGQHWAEKIAAELASRLSIVHARVEFAEFQRNRGSVSESFARDGRELFHGNQILAGMVLGYERDKRFRQSDHTLTNVFDALNRVFGEDGARRPKMMFAEYMVLDALIGNTDRHHENWGILARITGGHWRGMFAPSFDHASSLGRELVDDAPGKCRRRILQEGRIGRYAERARGALYWDINDDHGLSPLALVRSAASLHPELFVAVIERLERLERNTFDGIVGRVPDDWMSPLARQFAVELLCYNLEELRRIGQ